MGFVFVNVKNPKDALQLTKDTEVRSHVARYQWRNPTNRQAVRRRKEISTSSLHVNGQHVTMSSLISTSTRHEEEETLGTGETSIPPLVGGGLRVDPFRTYPINWRPFVPPLVDHYLVSMAVDIPELDQPGNKGLLRTSWFPLVMTDPALFLVIMLLAGSNHASVRSLPFADSDDQPMKQRLLGLRCEAMRAINQAVASQPTSLTVSDATIGAIAKMASYEAMFGAIQNYRLHMRAVTRAVELRGGLDSLGLNGLLRRIVVWIDRNAAFIHGSELHFPGATFVPGQPLPPVNPGHFLADS